MQDFPKITPRTTTKEESALTIDFKSTLSDYLRTMDLDAKFLSEFSFEDVKIVLITSVPGYHSKGSLNKYGHMKVRHWLSKEPPLENQHKISPVIAQASSIGSLTCAWLDSEFAVSFSPPKSGQTPQGQDFFSKGKKKPVTLTSTPPVNLVWPTVEFVRNSIDGYNSGGSLCFPVKNLKPFMNERKKFFHLYSPSFGRKMIPPHIKTYTQVIEFSTPTDSNVVKSSSSSALTTTPLNLPKSQLSTVTSTNKTMKATTTTTTTTTTNTTTNTSPNSLKRKLSETDFETSTLHESSPLLKERKLTSTNKASPKGKEDSFEVEQVSPGGKAEAQEDSASPKLSWVVLTSANLSQAAWGALQKGNTQLMIRSYEAGVLFLPSLIDAHKKVVFSVGSASFQETESEIEVKFPLPYTFPPTPYTTHDKPWVWGCSFTEPDIFGRQWEMNN